MPETLGKGRGSSGVDAMLPPDMALACAGAGKAGRDALTLVVLGVLAGAFIALGAIFMTVVLTGADGAGRAAPTPRAPGGRPAPRWWPGCADANSGPTAA
jgi:hypothetical protein